MNTGEHKTSKLVTATAIFDSVLFFVVVMALLWRPVPDQNRELVSAAVGFIAGWVTAVRNFLTGSTAGSEAKNQALADNAKTIAAAVPPPPAGPVDQMNVTAENVEVRK